MTKTLKELLAEQAQLDARIAAARKEASQEALKKVLELVNEFGFTAQQVFPWKPVAMTVTAKYLDEKTGATWTGRGKPPAWIAGKNREDFLIERTQPQEGPFLAQMAATAHRT
ncbi:H-NS family nucleoid-associated regulatory protein [Pantoea sp. 18069]|uniref:H-NS histone family protein n=1 Tax=Pantoea sp. 18069 TaxID=2681415 RepID=UPI001359EA57|nr:H-NS histone family protein [Pantoea sp. 18069]